MAKDTPMATSSGFGNPDDGVVPGEENLDQGYGGGRNDIQSPLIGSPNSDTIIPAAARAAVEVRLEKKRSPETEKKDSRANATLVEESGDGVQDKKNASKKPSAEDSMKSE
eukprot:4797386-Karenia_brevis.AAC.1